MILFSVLLSIIMLNLLISIIGLTFGKVLESQTSMRNIELLSVINEIDKDIPNFAKIQNVFGDYLLCFYNDANLKSEESVQDKLVSDVDILKKNFLEMKINNLENKVEIFKKMDDNYKQLKDDLFKKIDDHAERLEKYTKKSIEELEKKIKSSVNEIPAESLISKNEKIIIEEKKAEDNEVLSLKN